MNCDEVKIELEEARCTQWRNFTWSVAQVQSIGEHQQNQNLNSFNQESGQKSLSLAFLAFQANQSRELHLKFSFSPFLIQGARTTTHIRLT